MDSVSGYSIRHGSALFPVRQTETLIGRSDYCSVVIEDLSVSRQHAALRFVDGALTVVDLGSRNGTFVNGEEVKGPKVLGKGDVIVLGNVPLEVIDLAPTDQSRRRTTYVTPPATRPVLGETEQHPTIPTTTAAGLVDSVIAQAVEKGRTPEQVLRIRDAIDAVLLMLSRDGRRIPRDEALRLAAHAEMIASWVSDGSLDSWCSAILKRLAGASR